MKINFNFLVIFLNTVAFSLHSAVCSSEIKESRCETGTLKEEKKESEEVSLNQKINLMFLNSIYSNNLKEMKKALKIGVDIDLQDEDGDTALMIFARRGDTEIIEFLLSNNADVNKKNNYGNTALMCASEYNYPEVVKLLLENKADVNAFNKNGTTALMLAVQDGFIDVVRLLIEYEADIDIKNDDGYTALMYAAEFRFDHIVELLLRYKPEIDFVSETLLIFTEEKSIAKMIEILLKYEILSNRLSSK